MIDARQFLISQKQLNAPDFITIRLSDGYILSYHREMQVYIHESFKALLLGTAWQTGMDRKDPVEEIERLINSYPEEIPKEEILLMEESWCGRYVLIVQGQVYLDAAGLMGVFYGDGGISGSVRILAGVMGLEERIYQPSADMNWLPGPLTQYNQIRRLLPSQIYNYRTRSVHGRQLLASRLPECGKEEDRIRIFTEYFSCSLKNMARAVSHKKILIALTGGYDSRTLLALAVHAGIPFECFTLGYENISAGDREIPEELCRIVHCRYTCIGRNSPCHSCRLDEEYALHTGGLADDGDKSFYAYGQYQELARRFGASAVLRSSVWETATEYYMKIIGDDFEPERIYDYFNMKSGGLERASLDEYFQWVDRNRQHGMNAANRFYWEQRTGSWMSSIEQSFDMMDGIISLQPVNSRLLLTLLLGFPKEERIIRTHQLKIISFTCPELSNVRFGDSDRPVQAASAYRKKIKLGISRLHRLGLKKTIGIYVNAVRVKYLKKRLKKEKRRKA